MEEAGAPDLALRPPQRTSSIFLSVAKAQAPLSSGNRLTWPWLGSPPPPTSSRAHLRAQSRALHHAPRPPGRGSRAKWLPWLSEHASAASRPLPACAPPSYLRASQRCQSAMRSQSPASFSWGRNFLTSRELPVIPALCSAPAKFFSSALPLSPLQVPTWKALQVHVQALIPTARSGLPQN